MEDRTRRIELGKMLLDVAKYVLTIVVVGGLISEKIDAGTILLGLILGATVATIGFLVVPREEEKVR